MCFDSVILILFLMVKSSNRVYMERRLNSKCFPANVTNTLESFYKRGLTKWSGDRAELFQEALRRVPLDKSQLQVHTTMVTPDYSLKSILISRAGLNAETGGRKKIKIQ